MAEDPDASESENPSDSVDDMFVHLESAKERYQAADQRSSNKPSETKLQRTIRQRSDAAVLASNHGARLQELEDNEAVTHRSGKPWTSAAVGVEAHGRLPIYYRAENLVTHAGYISDIILHPSENTAKAEKFMEHISAEDTYSEYYDELDTTTFIVTDGWRLADPFTQSELKKISGEGSVDENYSRQPAYVVQRSGDFAE